VHVTEAYTCKFSEGARGHINGGYFAGNKWISQSGVTEHCLIRPAIISDARVGPRGKIGVGNFDSRPEGVRGDIGGEHRRPEGAEIILPTCSHDDLNYLSRRLTEGLDGSQHVAVIQIAVLA